jgi:carbonic anhydrase
MLRTLGQFVCSGKSGSKVGRVLSREITTDGTWKDKSPKTELDPTIDKLLSQNKAWVMLQKSHDPGYFERHGTNTPKYLWVGCSDARVPANELMGEPPGSVFVHRNIANMVVNTDVNLMAVLQYAVNYLNVSHIMVVGHYDCGGVKAAMTNMDHVSPLENWLRNIRDVYRIHYKELDSIKEIEARQRRLVELNVQEQCLNLYKTGVVQRKRMETYKSKEAPFTWPRIHGLVYDPKEGLLNKLPVNFKDLQADMSHIYTLFETDDDDVDSSDQGLGPIDESANEPDCSDGDFGYNPSMHANHFEVDQSTPEYAAFLKHQETDASLPDTIKQLIEEQEAAKKEKEEQDAYDARFPNGTTA